jgi:general stress protein 26
MTDTPKDQTDIVWDIVRKTGVAMVVTRQDGGLDARPLKAFPDPDAGVIWFMTDSEGLLKQIEQDPRVLLTLAGKGANDYAALEGQAVISNDRDKIRDLWTVWAQAYWESAEDPAIRLLVVTPEHARYWDGPNTLVTTVALIAGAVTGRRPHLGEAGEVSF